MVVFSLSVLVSTQNIVQNETFLGVCNMPIVTLDGALDASPLEFLVFP